MIGRRRTQSRSPSRPSRSGRFSERSTGGIDPEPQITSRASGHGYAAWHGHWRFTLRRYSGPAAPILNALTTGLLRRDARRNADPDQVFGQTSLGVPAPSPSACDTSCPFHFRNSVRCAELVRLIAIPGPRRPVGEPCRMCSSISAQTANRSNLRREDANVFGRWAIRWRLSIFHSRLR